MSILFVSKQESLTAYSQQTLISNFLSVYTSTNFETGRRKMVEMKGDRVLQSGRPDNYTGSFIISNPLASDIKLLLQNTQNNKTDLVVTQITRNSSISDIKITNSKVQLRYGCKISGILLMPDNINPFNQLIKRIYTYTQMLRLLVAYLLHHYCVLSAV